VQLFSSEVFFDKQIIFSRVPLFLSESFFNPMNEGSNSAHLFMASQVCVETLVELGDNLVSWFDFTMMRIFWGAKLY
jgi:hypothetical protein